MLDFRVHEKPALTFEGEKNTVLRALATKQPVHHLTTGGGMGGADSAGLAPAMEALGLSTPFSGNAVSVGVVNQLLAAYGKARALAHCYSSVFCSDEFVRPGAQAYIQGRKVSIDYYALMLRFKLRGAAPLYASSSIRVGLTNYETGKPVTLSPDLHNLSRVVRIAKASAFIPYVCEGKGYEMIDGQPLCDGGISQPLPLADALAKKPKYLVISMSTPECASNSLVNKWIEQKFADHKMAHLPASTRVALLQRHDVFNATLTLIRNQLELPLGHRERFLPPTLIAWPTAHYSLGMVEQNQTRVQKCLGAVYQQWWNLLREEKVRCAA